MANTFCDRADHPERIDEDVYQESMGRWQAERKQVEADLEHALNSPVNDRSLSAERIIDLAERAHEIYLRVDNSRRAELLKMLLSTCKTDGEGIQPEFRASFRVLFPS